MKIKVAVGIIITVIFCIVIVILSQGKKIVEESLPTVKSEVIKVEPQLQAKPEPVPIIEESEVNVSELDVQDDFYDEMSELFKMDISPLNQKEMYLSALSEEKHEIEEYTGPNDPVLLKKIYTDSDVGKKARFHGVECTNLLGSGETISLITSNSTITEVDANAGEASMFVEISSFAVMDYGLGKLKIKNKVQVKLRGNGEIIDRVSTLEVNGMPSEVKTYGLSPFHRPDEPVTIGKEFTFTKELDEELPTQYADEPVVVTGKIMKRVTFDGEDAVLIKVNSRSYNHVIIAEMNRDIWIAVDADTRYYYSIASGKILWSETNAEVKDENGNVLVTSVEREELWVK